MFQGLFAGILFSFSFFFPANASDLWLGDDSRWVNPSERRRCRDSLPSSLVRRVNAIGAQVLHNTERRLAIILIPARPGVARPGRLEGDNYSSICRDLSEKHAFALISTTSGGVREKNKKKGGEKGFFAFDLLRSELSGIKMNTFKSGAAL